MTLLEKTIKEAEACITVLYDVLEGSMLTTEDINELITLIKNLKAYAARSKK